MKGTYTRPDNLHRTGEQRWPTPHRRPGAVPAAATVPADPPARAL